MTERKIIPGALLVHLREASHLCCGRWMNNRQPTQRHGLYLFHIEYQLGRGHWAMFFTIVSKVFNIMFFISNLITNKFAFKFFSVIRKEHRDKCHFIKVGRKLPVKPFPENSPPSPYSFDLNWMASEKIKKPGLK